jgi:formyl-CoA transferase
VPIAIACGNDRQFARLTEVLGRPALATDPRFLTNSDRVQHQPELEALLEDPLARAPAAEWERRLTESGVPAGLVSDVAGAISRATDLELDPLLDLGPGEVRQVRHPVRYSATPSAAPAPPPSVGQHSELITAWLDDPAAGPLPHPGLHP